MARIDLTPDEARLLREILTVYLTDFRREIAGTESHDFREALERKEAFLQRLAAAAGE